MADAYEELHAHGYTANFEQAGWAETTEQRIARKRKNNEALAAMEERFQNDAIETAGLTGHPKASKAYGLAYELGHAYGYGEVLGYLERIAEVLLDD